MNKGELIEQLAAELNESKANAGRILDTVLGCITKGVKTDGSVTITGFGTFTRKHRAGRMGRNPATGEPMEIKPSVSVGFKASQAIKDAVS